MQTITDNSTILANDIAIRKHMIPCTITNLSTGVAIVQHSDDLINWQELAEIQPNQKYTTPNAKKYIKTNQDIYIQQKLPNHYHPSRLQDLSNQFNLLNNTLNTIQQAVNTVNSRANTADTKATQANADIIAERQSRADSENSIAQQISALDSKFTNADNEIKAFIATAQSQLNARFNGLVVGGRNLLLNSRQIRMTSGTTYFNITDNIDISSIKQVTVSCDVHYINANITESSARVGSEVVITYTDDTVKYVGAWHWDTQVKQNFRGRISTSFIVPDNKTIKRIHGFMQLRNINADVISVSNPKLELGTLATDWTPAPEDFVQGQQVYNTTTAQSPNVHVSADGILQRSTSSEKYKKILTNLLLDEESYKKALSVQPIIYRSLAEADNENWHYYSFSAEQLGKLDPALTLWKFPEIYEFDEDGNITNIVKGEPVAEGINLNAIVAFLYAICQKQDKMIQQIIQKLKQLEVSNE